MLEVFFSIDTCQHCHTTFCVSVKKGFSWSHWTRKGDSANSWRIGNDLEAQAISNYLIWSCWRFSEKNKILLRGCYVYTSTQNAPASTLPSSCGDTRLGGLVTEAQRGQHDHKAGRDSGLALLDTNHLLCWYQLQLRCLAVTWRRQFRLTPEGCKLPKQLSKKINARENSQG